MNYPTLILPFITAVLLIYFFCYYYKSLRPKAGTLEWVHDELKPRKMTFLKSHKMAKTDYMVLAVILIVSAFVGFWGLGDTRAPESFHSFTEQSDEVVIELSEATQIGGVMYYTGIYTGEYALEFSVDGETWTKQAVMEQKYSKIFQWLEVEMPEQPFGPVKYIRITAGTSPIEMGEIALYGIDGEILDTSVISNAGDYAELFDEQDVIPDYPSYMNGTYFDEIYYARTAHELMTGVTPYETTHPPLGKLIIMLGIKLFGLTPFGWRFMGALFGVLMLLPLYVLIKNIFGKTIIAACGTIIFSFDFMHYVQTRICTIDTYSVFFIILMYLFMYRYITRDYDAPFRKTLAPLALTGLFFGLGAAAKWTSIYAGMGLLALYVIHLIRRGIHCRKNDKAVTPWLVKTLLASVLFFIVVPLVIYYLSYIPYAMANGYGDTFSVIFKKEYVDMFADNQIHMFTYHSELKSEHPYSSTWYMWLLNIRPILYFRTFFEDGTKSLFAAFNNPVVSWGGLVAIISLFISYFRRRDSRALFILIGYFSQLLPWIIITRIAFAYHYFTCTIFIVLALCYVLNNIWERKNGRYRTAVYGFTGAVVVVFAMFYPVLSGATVAEQYAYNFLRWFPSWPL